MLRLSAAQTDTGQRAMPDTTELSGILSACEVAAALGVNERTVRRAIARGDLAATKFGRSFRITAEALADFRDRRHRVPLPIAGTSPAFRPPRQTSRVIPFLQGTEGLDYAPSDLARPLTPFLGREQEMAMVASLLNRPEVRLLTLTGPGGAGKTRLALQITEERAPLFEDQGAFVSLAPIADANLVPEAIARSLGVRDARDQFLGERLAALIERRHFLLVLDNFEHVLPAGPFIVDLLAACPWLTVLVTSRTTLRLSGEHAFPVPPMTLPGPTGVATAASAGQAEAVQLFVARASAATPKFALNDENASAVGEICRRLDGLPLAIELAAARVSHLTVTALLARLEQRLPLLTGGPRDAPPRQRAMRDAIAWSHDLLSPEARALFRQLSVFVGGFTLEAAEAVGRGSGEPKANVLEAISSLVDASLLQRVDQAAGEGTGDQRFGMLETIREYELERLEAAGEGATARDAHAAYYLAYVERIEADLYGGRGLVSLLETLEVEHPNLRAALAHLGETGDTEACLRLAGALAPFWLFHSHRGEGRGWLQAALDRARDVPVAAAPRAKSMGGAAVLAFTQGDYGRAAELAEEGLTLQQERGDHWGIATALNLLGAVERARGNYDLAALRFEAALALFEETGDTGWIALARGNLGILAFWRGDLEQATALLEDAVALYRQAGDLYAYGTAAALSDLALVSCDRGDHTRAAGLFAESLMRWREVGTKEGLADWLARVAVLATERGQFAQAARVFGAAEALREAIGYAFELPARARHERAMTAVRGEMGEAAFAAAMAAGGALSPDEAAAEAAPLVEGVAATGTAAAVHPNLTPRELEILRQVAAGRSDRKIADALFISRRTVNAHVAHILTKLDVHSRREAVVRGHELGLLTGDDAPPRYT